MTPSLPDIYDPTHVQGKVGGSSGSKKRKGKKVSEISTKKGGERKWKVHIEIQQENNKKQPPKQLKHIKPFILCPLTGDLTLRKSPSTSFGFLRKPKEKG
jgi:hypothetical protein